MNYKRKVKVDREKLYKQMYSKSCRLSVNKIAQAIGWNYDTIRHALMKGEIMPDTLQDMANYLGVEVGDLQ